ITFGRTLTGLLLPSQQSAAGFSIQELYKRRLEDATGQRRGLRLRLLLPSQLDILPWEYMYVDAPGGGGGIDGFLALNRQVSIVRDEVLEDPLSSSQISAKVKVVVALGKAEGLKLDKEQKVLKEVFTEQLG